MNFGDYNELTSRWFGEVLYRDVRNIKLNSIYPADSKYFQQCYEALLKVEHSYIQDLIHDLRVRGVGGAFVEFGIFQGSWIDLLHNMTASAGLGDRQIVGFDSFQGLSAPHNEHDVDFWKEGMYAASRQEVEARLRIHDRPRIQLVEGFFAESLTTPEANKLGEIAFARIDCDIYEPAKDCLAFLSDRLAHGSILVFDDWTHDFEKGEARAFAEWAPTVPNLKFEFIFLGPWDHLHLRVLHRNQLAG